MIGTVVGNYRITRQLGEGGMSHVYAGTTVAATELLPAGYEVVLKVMSEELAGEVTARKRFVKEAQILSKLRHRYITRFYEFINNDRGAVLVMEFVSGRPVDVLLSERGALNVREAVAIAQCLLEALVYAHGKGIIHRDIKPANLILDETRTVKVTDFGIAKIKEGGAGAGQTVLTRSGFLLGTPHYMSPEQIREPKEAGAGCDVYSTGVVLYEMLTGVLPFNSRSLPKLIDAIYRGEKQSVKMLRPEIDSVLDGVVLKAMHQAPAQRYESAREFYEALEEWSMHQPIGGAVHAPAAQPHAAPVAVAAPAHWSLVNVKPEAGESFRIAGESVMVGRDRACSIVLAHPAVSRRHARITIGGTTPVLEDLNSANGTYVNNSRIDRVKLKAGDVVRFGADPACTYVLKDQ